MADGSWEIGDGRWEFEDGGNGTSNIQYSTPNAEVEEKAFGEATLPVFVDASATHLYLLFSGPAARQHRTTDESKLSRQERLAPAVRRKFRLPIGRLGEATLPLIPARQSLAPPRLRMEAGRANHFVSHSRPARNQPALAVDIAQTPWLSSHPRPVHYAASDAKRANTNCLQP